MRSESGLNENSWTDQQVAAALSAAKTKLQRVRERLHEPLAVIGLGCRFSDTPGPRQFWEMLRRGHCPISETPAHRWTETLTASEDKKKGKITANQGAFLDSCDKWDANFFGISRREAVSLDPQHRLLMTVAWEALENAGLDADQLRGTRTGVFVGMCSSDYLHQLTTRDRQQIDAYLGTGNAHGTAVGRLSYFFNWQGPSLAVDTACSSSLTALHFAARSLRARDCDLAVVGGVNLILAPELSINLSQAGMLSATGRCHTFSSEADGFVRGEGCGVLLLKRLSEAQAEGDRIVCVLRGSAVNQDGRSNGLTAPNGLAQQAVIRSALADAQLEAHEIDYVEAHGTGTALGDPIEMGALRAVFAPQRAAERPLRVGSVKTNIGHLEGAAGIAGLLKVCLALEQDEIPPHLHFEQPSPHIDWNWPLQIPTTLTSWPRSATPRRAGVSSFGFGGTNAHVIVEEAPAPQPAASDSPPAEARGPALLVLSAKTPTALTARARQWAEVAGSVPLRDLCYTAAVGRTHLPHRLALPGHDPQQVQQALQQFVQQGAAPQLQHGPVLRECSLALVFGGQGPHCVGAGRALYQHDRTFRQLLDEACQVAQDYWSHDLRSVLWEEAARWDQVDIQPALFCLQISLARLWEHYSGLASVVLGHSLGEYAAACLAGVFSLEDALRLVTTRARLLEQLETAGQMLVVMAPHETVRGLLPDTLDIAAINAPRQTVVAGNADDIQRLETQLDAEQIRYRSLGTTHAFHSPLVEPILQAFGEVAQQVTYAAPQRRLISGMLGTRATTEVAQAAYWQQHLRQTVRFHPAVECLMSDDKPAVVLEMGAGSTAVSLIKSAFRSRAPVLLKGLSGTAQEWNEHLQRLGQLYVLGGTIDWQAVWSTPGRKISLPTYPFESQRYWFTAAATAATTSPRESGVAVHPLLGRRLDLAAHELVYETHLSSDSFLQDHRIGDRIVLPATGYLELAMAAGQDAGFKLLDVCQLRIRRPLELQPQAPVRLQVILAPQDTGFDCRILGRQSQDSWQLHATCHLRAEGEPLPEQVAAQLEPTMSGESMPVAEHYARCAELGLHYGAAFRGLCRLYRGAGQAWGQVQLPSGVDARGYLLHPALLDACLQVTGGALSQQQTAAWLPVSVKRYRLMRVADPAHRLHVMVRTSAARNGRTMTVDVSVCDDAECEVLYIEALRLRRVKGLQKSGRSRLDSQRSGAATAEQLIVELMQYTPVQRQVRVLQLIRSRVAEILESKVDDVPIDQPLDTLGLDSLMAFELREEIKQSIQVDISFEVFLQDVTLAELSATLTEQFTARVNEKSDDPCGDLVSRSSDNEEGLIEGAI